MVDNHLVKHSGNKMGPLQTRLLCVCVITLSLSLSLWSSRRMEMQAGWMRPIVAEEEEKPPETLLR